LSFLLIRLCHVCYSSFQAIIKTENSKAWQILRISQSSRKSTTATYVERVNLALDHVRSHFHEPLRLQELAKVARISVFHFHRVFQAIVGETPADFVKRLRLEKALAEMSLPRTPSLTSIALGCGFASSSDFSRSFKQQFGVPPSVFDIKAWRSHHGEKLSEVVERTIGPLRLPPRNNPDQFKVKIRELPARTMAYIRVANPYEGDAVFRATQRLQAWAEQEGFADNQWLGYQWENSELTSLADCQYQVAVEAEGFKAKGEIGKFKFPPMLVAEITIRGGLDLELRALQWLYGAWLPRSNYVPDDHPTFESWIGRPFAHGAEYFELNIQLPVRRI
jgi:AraC family transcriptional regulator